MNGQTTMTDVEYSQRKRITRREAFLKQMDQLIPWEKWINVIRPYYPKGKRGRPPRGIEIMLRMYLIQIWFNLSDEMVEDSIYDSYALRSFVGINFLEEQVPDATTLLKFRHLLEEHQLGEKMFEEIQKLLEAKGLLMHGGTIVDASIVNAPSSTKNASGERDPEMHQTKKGNQWYFGMKMHIGVDAGSGYVHSLKATAANVHDIVMAHELIRKDDEVVYGDSGYLGLAKRPEIVKDEHLSQVEYRIAERASSSRKIPEGYARKVAKEREYRKASIRSKVEHVFNVVKRIFGFRKVVYRGLAKNLNHCYMLFASANLLMMGWADRPSTA